MPQLQTMRRLNAKVPTAKLAEDIADDHLRHKCAAYEQETESRFVDGELCERQRELAPNKLSVCEERKDMWLYFVSPAESGTRDSLYFAMKRDLSKMDTRIVLSSRFCPFRRFMGAMCI